MDIFKSINNKLNKIESCCQCDNSCKCDYDNEPEYQDRYNTSASNVSSNPNRRDYTDYDKVEPEQIKPDITKNQDWITNPVLNTKEDIMFGCFAVEQYSEDLNQLILQTPTEFFTTAQYQDFLNEFNNAFNRALINLKTAVETAKNFEGLYNPEYKRN